MTIGRWIGLLRKCDIVYCFGYFGVNRIHLRVRLILKITPLLRFFIR